MLEWLHFIMFWSQKKGDEKKKVGSPTLLKFLFLFQKEKVKRKEKEE